MFISINQKQPDFSCNPSTSCVAGWPASALNITPVEVNAKTTEVMAFC